ncbi:sod [Hyphantria cunea granulovirus]|uniref:Sod n=1 Tax=Hyphantria cunea granulovirus TaxID=307448 RepID=A0AAF1D276_9BBAC|nr:sod [Hyphantria cunea granulovirus]QBQ01604.1 sod [Hyphantria cunea granulovirus]
MEAICVMQGDVKGEVTFKQNTFNGLVKINGCLYNLPKGNHGLHVHEFGDMSNGCTSAGEHLNPHHKTHGAPFSRERHLGDLGNVYSSGALVTRFEKFDNQISLFNKYNVLGRSLVVHALEDDYGTGNNELSKTTGNSGSRLGCGIIGRKQEIITPF